MTPKPIIYSRHAASRIKRRGIRRPDVRALLAKGERTRIGEGVFEARGYLGRREAAVIYRESRGTILVITVEWIGDDE